MSTPENELARARDAAALIDDQRDEAAIEAGIVKAIEDTTVNASIRTVARVKSMIDAYCRVNVHFVNFVADQAEKLDKGEFDGQPFKEMSVANLVAKWLLQAEDFIDANAGVLHDSAQVIKRRFVEEALEGLPEASRQKILDELQDRRNLVAVWLVGEIERAKREISAEPKA